MDLSERQKKILRAVVESYIATAEPVGSKAIAALPDIRFSSATIRNEMAALEDKGLLEQPHTSAGRIPSPAGYRFYIDELMQNYRLSMDEAQNLSQAMEGRMQEFDKVISQVGQMVSKLTNLPAYAVASHSAAVTASRFEVLAAAPGSFILVLMTNDEAVHNKLIKLPLEVAEQDLRTLSAVLNAGLTDLPESAVTPALMEKLQRSAGAAANLVPVIVDFTVQTLREAQKNEVFLTGQTKLLGQPEYHDVDKATALLNRLDETTISSLPAPGKEEAVKILVGPENISDALKDTSVVMARYDIGDGMQGMIGVVGPTRMDYAQVAARLSYFAEGLGKMFSKTLPAAGEQQTDSLPKLPNATTPKLEE